MPTRRSLVVAATLLGLSLATFGSRPSRAADQGVLLRDRDRVSAEVTAGDEDAFDLYLAERSTVQVKVAAAKGSKLRPKMTLRRPDGADFDLWGFVTGAGTGAPSFKVKVPAGGTGRWQVRVTGAGGTTGRYSVVPVVTPPGDVRAKGLDVAVGTPVEIPFCGDTGASVRYTVRKVAGSLPAEIRIVGPDGLYVPGTAVTPGTGKTSVTVKKFVLGQGFGRYALHLDPAADGASKHDVQIHVDLKAVRAVRSTLPAEATVASVTPSVIRQDDSASTLELAGSELLAGSTARVDGAGVSVRSFTLDDAGSAQLVVDVATDAPYGLRRVILFPPELRGESVALADAVTVRAPDPTITSVNLASSEQGGAESLFEVIGTGFRTGGTISVSGTGVPIGPTEVVSATLARATISIAAGAAVGPRDVSFTQPAEGGGAKATLTAAFDVSLQGPTFTSMTPSVVKPTDSHVVLRIVGTNFNQGTTTTFTGGGVTVHSTTFLSTTAIDVDVSVAADAALGPRSVTITPAVGGGPAKRFTDKLVVAPTAPSVTSFSHGFLAPGGTFAGVTVRGLNFRAGDTVAASGTGVTFSGVTVIDASEITATATVSGAAALGLRDVTVSHSAADGGVSGTLPAAFRITGAIPSIVSVAPGAVGVTGAGGPARDVPLTITGGNFVTGATLAFARTASSGVSVVPGSVVVVSNTRIDATISLAGAATVGLWNALVTNPGTLGSSGSSGNSLLDVRSAATLTVNRVIASSGGPFGGERVTLQGSGFADGQTVDFGTVRAAGVQVIDAFTMMATVPKPVTVSRTAETPVSVKVTPASGTASTLANGYRYGADAARFVTVRTVPAQGATGVAKNLRSAVVVLSAPANTGTGVYGTSAGLNTFWYEQGGGFTSGGTRAFGTGGRFLVFTRPAGGADLPVVSQGVYVLDIPVTLWSLGGNQFQPTRLAPTLNHDQQSFTISPTAADTTPATLSTIQPANGSAGQDTTTKVVLTFNEELDPLTVSLSTITFTKSGTTVPAAIALSDDLKTVTITPEAELAVNSTYTTAVTSGVRDLFGNDFAAVTRTFTTGSGTDAIAPTIDSVRLESLPDTLDGSGTYVNSAGAGGKAFDVYLPRDGWLVVVKFSDAGGSGIDAATFSARCSVAVGASAPNAELAAAFDVSGTAASWRIPASTPVTAGDNVTFTFSVKDRSGNTAASHVVTVDVIDRDATAISGGDHDPVDARRTWILRADLDAFTAVHVSTTTPSPKRGATTSVAPNGIPDLDEALRLIGLNTASMTPAAAATTSGADTGTNAIVRRLFLDRLRELLNERFWIAADGTHDANSVNVEFLLPGEQGSLAAWPGYSSSGTAASSKPFSELSVGGTVGADANAYTTASKLGDAWYDARNLHEEANVNAGGASDTGVYLLGAFKLDVNSNSLFKTRISNVLVAVHGGVPAGENASDDDVLAGTFDRTASSDATKNARYDALMDAVEYAALYVSAISAHEIGHSLGLVPDGPPKTGLFGAAHYANTFTEATSAAPNTSNHLDYLGNDLMAGSTTFDTATWTGVDFKRFSPMDVAYLRNRLLHDEGK